MRCLMLAACLASGLAQPAFGQEAVRPLTMIDALGEALSGNPELVALRREYDAARTVPAQARFLEAPSFDAQVWALPVTTLNPIRADMYMLMGGQAFPGRGKRASRELVGERGAEVAQRQVAMRANDILDEVRQAYVGLTLARETVVLYDRQIPVLRRLTEAVTLRVASGHAAQHDAVQPFVALSRLQAEVITWQARVRSEEAHLNTLLGRQVSQRIGPTVPVMVTNIPADPVAVALERHPAMSLVAAEIAREEAELARLEGERRPDFMVGGGYMLMPGEAGAWTASAGITWPNAPWSRGGLDAEIATQALRVEAVAARREAIANAIRGSVYDAEIRIDAARQRAGLVATTTLPHIQHAFDVSRTAYAAGRAPFADVIDGHRAMLAADVEYAIAQAEVAFALADLQRAIGAVQPDAAPAHQEQLP
jgi:outer membrane protein TolC